MHHALSLARRLLAAAAFLLPLAAHADPCVAFFVPFEGTGKCVCSFHPVARTVAGRAASPSRPSPLCRSHGAGAAGAFEAGRRDADLSGRSEFTTTILASTPLARCSGSYVNPTSAGGWPVQRGSTASLVAVDVCGCQWLRSCSWLTLHRWPAPLTTMWKPVCWSRTWPSRGPRQPAGFALLASRATVAPKTQDGRMTLDEDHWTARPWEWNCSHASWAG